MDIDTQRQNVLKKLGISENITIGNTNRSISMNINRSSKKGNRKKNRNRGCTGCSRKSGKP